MEVAALRPVGACRHSCSLHAFRSTHGASLATSLRRTWRSSCRVLSLQQGGPRRTPRADACGAQAARRRPPEPVRAESRQETESFERGLSFEDFGALSDKVQELAPEVRDRLEGTSLYLVGMMGSGKSTVGRLLGAALRYPFLDTDALVEAAAGCSVADIFAADGEESFRAAETQVLQELMPFKAVVVATGGGAVTRRANWGYMQHGVVAWLAGPPALLARRALADGAANRPLLGAAEPTFDGVRAKLAALLDARGPQYATADLQVSLEAPPGGDEAAGAPPALVAYRLLLALNERLKGDAAKREDSRAFEIRHQGDLPGTLRVMPSRTPLAPEE